jgi:hypothetical protein
MVYGCSLNTDGPLGTDTGAEQKIKCYTVPKTF